MRLTTSEGGSDTECTAAVSMRMNRSCWCAETLMLDLQGVRVWGLGFWVRIERLPPGTFACLALLSCAGESERGLEGGRVRRREEG